MEMRTVRVTLKPPHKKSLMELKPLVIDAILVTEINPPQDTWLLLTNYPTETEQDVIARIHWYSMRWHIENFHRVLKSGCTVEAVRLETSDRLKRYITLMSIIAWRLYWMVKVSRTQPQESCEIFLSEHEWKPLYCKTFKTRDLPSQPPTIREAIHWIARLGGFLDRKGDGEPGSTTLWRGWQRLTDLSETWRLIYPDEKSCG